MLSSFKYIFSPSLKRALRDCAIILNEIQTNLYDAIYLEIKIHSLNKQYSYIPSIKFGGYTECFSHLVNLEELNQLETVDSISII